MPTKEQTPDVKRKLHVGCGVNYFPGWINIDNNSDNNISQLDLHHDLRLPLPFYDNSADFIYNEHFLEHLEVPEAIRAIKDFMRVLKPGGVLRIAMPDLDDCIAAYRNPDWAKASGLKKYGLTFIQTPCELLNISMRAWGHKWLYNWEELERRLKEAGCVTIQRRKNGQSVFPEFQSIETRGESTLIAEVTK